MDIYDPGVQRISIAAFVVALAVVLGLSVGYFMNKSDNISAPKIDLANITNMTSTARALTMIKPSPTLTSSPSNTPSPSGTPTLTNATTPTLPRTPTFTPTETQSPTATQNTQTPTRSPTARVIYPTNTHVPPVEPPPVPPPVVVINSCKVDPFTVPVNTNVPITFMVQFSAPGYGFDASNNPGHPGQAGCSGSDNDGDSMAYCVGSSGELPTSTTIYVTLKSSIGECVVNYSAR